jgi:hypothetical protein
MTILALTFGVFYREYTKFLGFEGETMLSLLHTHTFVLAVILPLLFTLIIQQLQHTTKELKSAFWTYYLGWGVGIAMMLARGITQAQELVLSSGMDHMISGITGLGHIILSAGFIWIFLKLIKRNK